MSYNSVADDTGVSSFV